MHEGRNYEQIALLTEADARPTSHLFSTVFKAAKEWFLNATLANFADDRSMGWYFLVLLYANGPETDGEMALRYFEKVAAEAWAELGHCYMNGIGSEKDLDKAAECFERGADAGDMAFNVFLVWKGMEDFPMLLKKTRILIGRFEGSLRLAAEGADVLIFAADYPPYAS